MEANSSAHFDLYENHKVSTILNPKEYNFEFVIHQLNFSTFTTKP